LAFWFRHKKKKEVIHRHREVIEFICQIEIQNIFDGKPCNPVIFFKSHKQYG